jgi:hypothetical protein
MTDYGEYLVQLISELEEQLEKFEKLRETGSIEERISFLHKVMPEVKENPKTLVAAYWINFDDVEDLEDAVYATPQKEILKARRNVFTKTKESKDGARDFLESVLGDMDED